MPSTYSPLKIELIATGEQSGTWGTTTNTNLGTAIEEAITGSADVTFVNGSDTTVTLTDVNTTQAARNLRLNLVGSANAAQNLILGSGCQIEKLYLINNTLTQTITVKNTTGTGIAVPAGKSMFVYNNGTNVVEAVNSVVTLESTQVNITGQGDLRLEDSSGGQYVALQAPGTVASSYTLTLPVDDGTSGQALITDGNGVLSWSTAASGDVYGPASATDNAIARFDGTTGKIIQNSAVTIADTTGDITTAGYLITAAGAVGTPALTTTGDTNTGIFFPAADTIAFTEGGVESMRITSSGNVGIGTSSPSFMLDVNSNVIAVGTKTASSTLGGNIRFRDDTGTVRWLTGILGGAGATSYSIYDLVNSASRVTIDSSGNVGIGATPDALLTVNTTASFGAGSAASPSIAAKGDLDTGMWFPAANTTAWSTNGSERMRIDSSGNVGIGTSSPAYRLDVATSAVSAINIDTTANTGDTPAALRMISNGGTGVRFLPVNGTGKFNWQIAAQTNVNNALEITPSTASGGTTFSTPALVINSSGNVGIGTSSPTFKLEVNQSGAGIVHTDGTRTFATYLDSSGVWLGSRSNNNLQFYTNNGAVQLTLSTSGNLGLGVTPAAWSGFKSLDFSAISYSDLGVLRNAYYNGSSYIYRSTAAASQYQMGSDGSHNWYRAASGTAGNAITFTQAMTLDASGNVGIGTTAPQAVLDLGTGTAGRGLTWGGSTGANRYASIFAPFSNGGIVLSASFHGSTSADSYINSYTGTTYANGIRLNTFGADGIQFFTDGSASKTAGNAFTPTERMRIDSSGNVGIGTTSPNGKLEVTSTSAGANTDTLYLNNLSSNAGTATSLVFGVSTGPTVRSATIKAINNGGNAIDLTFLTSSGAVPAERMRIDSSGNVGIGTSSPDNKLEVVVGDNAGINIEQSGSLQTGYLNFRDSDGTLSGRFSYDHGNDSMRFNTATLERMRIDSSGNVGIGTSSPNTKLEVTGAVRATNSGSSGYFYRGYRSGTTSAWYVYDSGTEVQMTVEQANPLLFGTSNTERMRITSAGRVGIGITSPSRALHVATGVLTLANNNGALFTDTNNAGVLLGSDNAIGYISGVTAAGTATAKLLLQPFGDEVLVAATTDNGAYNLQCNGTGVWGAGAYVNGSDERIKENIQPLNSGLDVVQKLNPVTYKYKETWSKDQSTQTGFIAQELLTALEGEVYIDGVVQQGGQEEYYSVAYQNIIPILTKAIQELNAKVEAQAAEIALLKSK
jgi:hypothetical protein